MPAKAGIQSCGSWIPALRFAAAGMTTMTTESNVGTTTVVTFPVEGGIFGVGRLATRLTELAARHQIGGWHIGHWVDWRHTAIRVDFDTAADAALARSACGQAATA